MKNWLVIIVTIAMLSLLVWAMHARGQATPVASGMKSITTCNTDDRVTYVTPGKGRMIDFSFHASTINNNAYLRHVSGERYNQQPLLNIQGWLVNEQYHGESVFELVMPDALHQNRRYVITDSEKPVCDLNKDGSIDLLDFAILTNNWLEQL